jgi:NADPH:quinone reductase-like Zn-dependent oxidoreductase
MKAIVIREYGGPNVLKLEDYPDPVAGAGEVLLRVAATSVNPFEFRVRSGAMKDLFPLQFPTILGTDVSGTVLKLVPGAQGFSVGDKVFGMASRTYAELCTAKSAALAKIPAGLDMIEAAALPVATTTGNQLISLGVKPCRTENFIASDRRSNQMSAQANMSREMAGRQFSSLSCTHSNLDKARLSYVCKG